MALPKLLYSETYNEPLLEKPLTVIPTGRGVSPDDRFDGEVEEQREESFTDGPLAGPRRTHFMATTLGDPDDADCGVLYEKDPSRTKWEEAAIYIQEGIDNDKFIHHPRGKWSRIAYLILHHPIFYITDLTVSILLMLLAIFEEPSVISIKDHQPLIIAHSIFEILFLAILVFDIVLRFIWFGPKHFIKHKRTMFISFVLVVMFGEAVAVLIRRRNHFRITRALRPFFFIDTYLAGGVRRVLRQVFYSLKPIIDVLLLLLFTVTFFALMGYYLFATISFTYFSTFAQSFVSLYITLTTANNPDVMMESYSLYSVSPLFFITYLIITVYFVSNILLAVVYSEFSNENKKKCKSLFLHQREALFYAHQSLARTSGPGVSFEDFVKLMHIYKPRTPEWQMMCMFKALQCNYDEQNWYLTQEEFYGFYEVGNYKWTKSHVHSTIVGLSALVLSPSTDVVYLIKDDGELWWQKLLQGKMQIPFHYIDKLVMWNGFDIIVVVVVTLYNLFLAIYTLTISSSEADTRYDKLRLIIPVSFVVIILYGVEIVLRIIGRGPMYYFRSFWNVIDFIIVFVSLLFLCLETNPTYSYFLAVRPVVMARYLILRRRYRNILNTMVLISPRLISVGLLILVVFYFFAIIGMEAFGPREDGNLVLFEGCCNTSWFGVGQFYEGPTTVPIDESIATSFSNNVFLNSSYMNIGTTNVYYLNNFNNIFSSFVTLFILMVVNNWYIIMEGVASEVRVHWLARIYFMIFNVITLVILQVIISFIVEAFVLRIRYIDKERDCEVHHKYHRCLHTEKEGHNKRTEIKIVQDDLQKLKYQVTYDSEKQQKWTFSRIIRHLRRIDLKIMEPNTQVFFKGRRRRTKDDINLLLYKYELPKWIEDHQPTQCRSESASTPKYPLWKTFLKTTKKFILYILE